MRRKPAEVARSKAEMAARRERIIEQATALREQGKTWGEISAETGAPRTTLQKWFRPPSAPKPKAPKPKPAPIVRVEMSPELASRVIVLSDGGMAAWTIARRTHTTVRDVERVIARAKLQAMVGDGRLTIRFAEGEELERLRRDRELHDRRALQERDRLAADNDKAAA